MGNKTSWKAVQKLCSPFSLTAMMVLLVNDQLLRIVWPSWWTGKLGDLAWLFFFPFALAVVLAGLIPPRVPRQERIVQGLAFGFTGGVFALAKTVPLFHDLLIRTLETVLGVPVTLVRDPSDLLALVSLGMSWRFWERPPHPASFRAAPRWAVLSCAALLTIANSAPSVGIDVVCSKSQRAYAYGSYSSTRYVSTDGGLSWQNLDADRSEDEVLEEPCESTRSTGANQLEVDSNVGYRFESPHAAIERTEDGGQSWQRAFTLSGSEASSFYYEERCGDLNCDFEPGPHSATLNPATGNVIFAMGLEGVLVRKSSGEWVWASVGGYSHIEPGRGDVVFMLLSGEILLAIGFALLCTLTLLRRLHPSRRRRVLLVLFWITGAVHAFLMQGIILHESYFEGVEVIGHALTFAACLVLAFLILWDIPAIAQHTPGLLKRLAVVGLSVAVVFLIPYLLWALDIVREYGVAVPLAYILGIVTLFGGNRWTHGLVQAVREQETAKV